MSAEAPAMFELQLGHLCNDRCVFCISGRITHAGEARLLPLPPLEQRLRAARAAGHRALTFLGGEPTIQPVFLPLVKLAVELGFDPIVIFTNGSKSGRTDLLDQVLATGGHFEWRFSFQGATEEAHEATTRRRGSFRQLLQAVERAARRHQRITVNTCVVAQNHASLGSFGALLAPFGVAQLHVDMIHPEDTGDLSLDELRPMMVRYTEVVPHLRAMIAGLPAGFDVNIGNLPQCLAPDLARWIHHGGPRTETSQASDFGLPVLQPSRDKYAFKERKKQKAPACRGCAFDDRCSGLFPEYVAIYGMDELRPIAGPVGPIAPHDVLALERAVGRLAEARLVQSDGELRVAVGGSTLVVSAPGTEADAGYDRGSVRLAPGGEVAPLHRLDEALLAEGWRCVHPPGDDAAGGLSPRLAEGLRRWRRAAPFGALRWTATHLERDRVEIELRGDAARMVAFIDGRGSGYRVLEGAPGPAEALGLRACFAALRSPRGRSSRADSSGAGSSGAGSSGAGLPDQRR